MGLGTYQVAERDLGPLIDAAIASGYVFIDTAECYKNEAAFKPLIGRVDARRVTLPSLLVIPRGGATRRGSFFVLEEVGPPS